MKKEISTIVVNSQYVTNPMGCSYNLNSTFHEFCVAQCVPITSDAVKVHDLTDTQLSLLDKYLNTPQCNTIIIDSQYVRNRKGCSYYLNYTFENDGIHVSTPFREFCVAQGVPVTSDDRHVLKRHGFTDTQLKLMDNHFNNNRQGCFELRKKSLIKAT
jgi:hypothetical protein